MKESKWKLPSRSGWGGEVWTVETGSRLDKVITRAVQAESDLTDALDMLEEAAKNWRMSADASKRINDYLNKFRSHK